MFIDSPWRLEMSMYLINMEVRNIYLGWNTGLESLNIASSEKLAAKTESPEKVRSVSIPVNFCLGEILTSSLYPPVPKPLNYGMWEILWTLHGSSGPCGHMQLLTAALPAGMWLIIVTGGKPDPYFREHCRKGESARVFRVRRWKRVV